MTWQGVSEAECYDNRSVIAQIMRLKDRVRVLEEEGSEEIQHEIELINEELTILEGKVSALESGKADDSAVVKLTGAQTVQGVKTFTSSPIVPTPTANNEAATKKYVDDNTPEYTAGLGLSISNDVIGIEQNYADNLVKKTGNQQTINSLIVFNTMPRAPGTPTNDSDVANKYYVDTVAGGGGGGGTSYTAGTGLQLVGTEFSLDSATQTAVSAVSGKADDNAVVKLAGAQTVAGVKTFSDSPIVPTPTTDYQVATKKYVDDNAGGTSGTWTTLAVSEYTSARFNELLPSDASGIRTTTAEIVLYYRYNISSGASRNGFITIPKGAKLLDTATIDHGNASTAATYLITISISLKDVFTTTNPTAAISKFTGSTTTRTSVSATINISDIPYNASPTTTDNVNICIQYR